MVLRCDTWLVEEMFLAQTINVTPKQSSAWICIRVFHRLAKGPFRRKHLIGRSASRVVRHSGSPSARHGCTAACRLRPSSLGTVCARLHLRLADESGADILLIGSLIHFISSGDTSHRKVVFTQVQWFLCRTLLTSTLTSLEQWRCLCPSGGLSLDPLDGWRCWFWTFCSASETHDTHFVILCSITAFGLVWLSRFLPGTILIACWIKLHVQSWESTIHCCLFQSVQLTNPRCGVKIRFIQANYGGKFIQQKRLICNGSCSS